MKQIRILYVLLAAVMVLASCSKTDDSSTTLYSDAAITAFTLGTMTRVDGDAKKTYAGSAYQFFIDQKARVVYNVDSLPIGTDVTAVYCAVSTLNNGLAMLVDHTTETMSYHSSSTPVDFTEPRKFRIYSSDGSGYTTYTSVNDGGVQNVLSGGKANDTYVSNGGVQNVSSGGTALSTTVKNGGKQTAAAGGG